MADCLFCKIVTGDIPAELVAEGGRTIAFRDINPQAPTHVLVIPRVHYPDAASLAAAEPQVVADILRESREVAAGDNIEDTGYRVVFNTGAGAGQTVKTMTAVTAILMVDALIAGIYGMNFENIPELHWPYGYAWALLLMLVVSGALWGLFKRIHWW